MLLDSRYCQEERYYYVMVSMSILVKLQSDKFDQVYGDDNREYFITAIIEQSVQ